jgi:hypothetical protein
MGIKNFHQWLKEKYSNCFLKCNKMSRFDYIYIDINHLLHNSINNARSEREFVNRLYSTLDLLFCNFIATKKVIIGIDGPSPYSKIILQRKRRSLGLSKLDASKISSIYLTPGTKFMIKLDNYINKYISRLKQIYKYTKTEFEYISSVEPDEGEIKIFDRMKKNTDPNCSHLVIGNDADIIILATAIKTITNINILIKNVKTTEILSIDKIMAQFCLQVPTIIVSKNNWRSDFSIVSLMLGNDYLPKLVYIKYDSVWKSYFDTIKENDDIKNKTIITNQKFNANVLAMFFNNVVLNISTQFRKLNMKTYNKDQVINYLEGLLWCLHMYETGKCSMYDYTYNFSRSPTPAHIYHYLTKEDNNEINIPTSNVSPIKNEIYTLLVMPKKAQQLIPHKYHNAMENELKHLYEVELCDECKKIRGEISSLSKEMKELRKNDDDISRVKRKLALANADFMEHKEIHGERFSVKDIQKILSIC